MARPDRNLFTLPTVEQVRRHLERHRLTGPSRLGMWLPLAGLALVLVLTASVREGPAVALPWLVLIGIFVYTGWRTARFRGLEVRAQQIQELTVLRRWPQALRLAWRLLPQTTTLPELHSRTVALLAHNLDLLGAYEAAITAYDNLITRLPADHPGSIQLQVRRALAQLAADHLLDADTSIRRLRSLVGDQRGTGAAAALRLANLFQSVRTNHDHDAIQFALTLVGDLRPLGMEAGYGYGLLALAYFRLAQRPPENQAEPCGVGPSLGEQARLWWARAALLLPPAELAQRFAEIKPLLANPDMVSAAAGVCPPPDLTSRGDKGAV